MDGNRKSGNIDFPSIIFRAGGGLYCLNSKYTTSILELPEHQSLPDAPDYITGIFPFRKGSVTMFDLRVALKQPALEEEFNEFSKMLDERKHDHIVWVEALRKSMETGEIFALATDPHRCALGRWYDSFHSDSQVLTHHLDQLDEPHKKLHAAAAHARECEQRHDQCERDRCLKEILRETEEEYMPRILNILEDAKEIFRSKVYHEMVLVLSGDTHLGIVVDEVLAVERIDEERIGSEFGKWQFSPYISRIVRSESFSELILEINYDEVIKAADFSVAAGV